MTDKRGRSYVERRWWEEVTAVGAVSGQNRVESVTAIVIGNRERYQCLTIIRKEMVISYLTFERSPVAQTKTATASPKMSLSRPDIVYRMCQWTIWDSPCGAVASKLAHTVRHN